MENLKDLLFPSTWNQSPEEAQGGRKDPGVHVSGGRKQGNPKKDLRVFLHSPSLEHWPFQRVGKGVVGEAFGSLMASALWSQ